MAFVKKKSLYRMEKMKKVKASVLKDNDNNISIRDD